LVYELLVAKAIEFPRQKPKLMSFVVRNADNNASLVIKKRAIHFILDTGTVLSDNGVLRTKSDSGRGGKCKSGRVKSSTSGVQRNVKKEKLAA